MICYWEGRIFAIPDESITKLTKLKGARRISTVDIDQRNMNEITKSNTASSALRLNA